MSQIKSFDQIKADNIYRYKSGFRGLDKIYGSSIMNGITYVGLPVGQISLWAGAGGVGKTRMAIEMVLRINATGSKVLFYQNEVTPSAFKSWVKKPVVSPNNLFVINYSSLKEQIGGILEVKPNVVIVDSINMLDGFTNPTMLRQILIDYKKTIEDVGCHAIFISHLNKEGQVKGNNDIEYLVDTVASLTHLDVNPATGKTEKGIFKLLVGKNRYGLSGGWIAFKHESDGVRDLWYFDGVNNGFNVDGKDYIVNPNAVKKIPVPVVNSNEPEYEPLEDYLARQKASQTDMFGWLKKMFS